MLIWAEPQGHQAVKLRRDAVLPVHAGEQNHPGLS